MEGYRKRKCEWNFRTTWQAVSCQGNTTKGNLMIIAILALILQLINFGDYGRENITTVEIITPATIEAGEWAEFEYLAYCAGVDEFNSIYAGLKATTVTNVKSGTRVIVRRSTGRIARTVTVKAANCFTMDEIAAIIFANA